MPSAEHKRVRAPVCDVRAAGRGISFFYLSIILWPVNPPPRRLAGVELLQPLFLVLSVGKQAGVGDCLVPADRSIAVGRRCLKCPALLRCEGGDNLLKARVSAQR